MSRQYTEAEKAAALARLAANGGSAARASHETGIPASTLRGWARQQPQPTPSPADTDALAQLRQALIHNAVTLALSLDDAIADAPLGQRAAALNQLIDKILKLADRLPANGEQVIRIEYGDSDGTTHEAPPWARDDHPA
jgi:hypothetical protein